MQKRLSSNAIAAAGVAALLATNVASATVIATFDDLPNPPPLASPSSLQSVNNNSLSYKGVTWDSNFTVVGDQYRVDTITPGPLYGKPHSGHYFVTNQSGADGLLITTDMVLTGAWFGPNEYFGFGRGADKITIVALSGAAELGSVTHALPAIDTGQPDPLQFVDTSAFLGFSGITGYRIDREVPDQFHTNWVADDFQFEIAQAPNPATIALIVIGLVALLGMPRRPAPR